MYEKLKNFKMDLKLMKINFEKDKNMIIDTDYSSSIFQRIKNQIYDDKNLEQYSNLKYIKEDFDWFIQNENLILELYKKKFNEAVMKMVIYK